MVVDVDVMLFKFGECCFNIDRYVVFLVVYYCVYCCLVVYFVMLFDGYDCVRDLVVD